MDKKTFAKLGLVAALGSVGFTGCTTGAGNSVGIAQNKVVGKTIITYNPTKEALSKNRYSIKDGKLVKSINKLEFPSDSSILSGAYSFKFKSDLEKLGCGDLSAKACIEEYIPTNSYFELDGEKSYILPQEFASKMYETVHDYNQKVNSMSGGGNGSSSAGGSSGGSGGGSGPGF